MLILEKRNNNMIKIIAAIVLVSLCLCCSHAETLHDSVEQIKSDQADQQLDGIGFIKENLGDLAIKPDQFESVNARLEELSEQIFKLDENAISGDSEARINVAVAAVALLVDVNKIRFSYLKYLAWEADQLDSCARVLMSSSRPQRIAEGLYLASLGVAPSLQQNFSSRLSEVLRFDDTRAQLQALSACLFVAQDFWNRAWSLEAIINQKSLIKKLSLSQDPDIQAVASGLLLHLSDRNYSMTSASE